MGGRSRSRQAGLSSPTEQTVSEQGGRKAVTCRTPGPHSLPTGNPEGPFRRTRSCCETAAQNLTSSPQTLDVHFLTAS